jgi:hypothetical protein
MNDLIREIAATLGRFPNEPAITESRIRALRREALRRNEAEAIIVCTQSLLMIAIEARREREAHSLASSLLRLRGESRSVRDLIADFCGHEVHVDHEPDRPGSVGRFSCICCRAQLDDADVVCRECGESIAAVVHHFPTESLAEMWSLTRSPEAATHYAQIDGLVGRDLRGRAFAHLLMADAFLKMGLGAEAILQSSEAILSPDSDESQEREAMMIMFQRLPIAEDRQIREYLESCRL